MTNTGANARRWSWGGDVVAPAGQAIMEATWLYAWVLVIAVAVHSTSPGFAPIILPLICGAWLGRFARLLPWRYPLNFAPLLPATAVALPAWLHVMLLPTADWSWATWSFLFKPESEDQSNETQQVLIVIGGLGVYLWFRGVWIGIRPPSTELLGKWLMGGTAAFVALFGLLAATSDPDLAQLSATLEALVLVYFIVALSLISLIHAQTLNRRAATRQPISASWLIALSVPMAGIASLGILISSNVAPALNRFMHLLVQVSLLLGRLLFWIAYWLMIFLDWLSKLFPAGTPQEVPSRTVPPKPPPKVLAPDWDIAPVQVGPWPFYLLIGVATAFLLFVFLRLLLQRPKVERAEFIDEERNSVWSWQLFRSQLRALIDRLLGRLRHEAPRAWTHRPTVARTPEPFLADIRQIYRRLLVWAVQRGHPRGRATTTQELLRELSTAAPQAREPLSLITETYEFARYGESQIAEGLLTQARAASERLIKLAGDAQPKRRNDN